MTFIKRTIRPIVFSVLSVLGGITLGATLVAATTTISTAISTAGDITTTAGNITATAGNLTVGGLSSTTQLLVGSDRVSTISGMIFGTCTIPQTTLTASTTTQVTCASATGVTTSYKVFVQATSSIPAPIVILSATSSAGAIEVVLYDTGIATTTTINIAPATLNFWAVR